MYYDYKEMYSKVGKSTTCKLSQLLRMMSQKSIKVGKGSVNFMGVKYDPQDVSIATPKKVRIKNLALSKVLLSKHAKISTVVNKGTSSFLALDRETSEDLVKQLLRLILNSLLIILSMPRITTHCIVILNIYCPGRNRQKGQFYFRMHARSKQNFQTIASKE